MAKFQILMSCMFENEDILKKANIKSDCVVINQSNACGEHIFNMNSGNSCLWINSLDRGLSKSRNLAIRNANADICLIADDDEIFDGDCEEKIKNAYIELKDADIVIFDIYNYPKKIPNKIFKFNFMQLLRVSSVQITFVREKIVANNLSFDEKLGAGTGNGAGEENKFLLDAYNKGLKIYHYPLSIAKLITDNKSTWFSGYNEEYFYKRGMATRHILGLTLSFLYAFYFVLVKRDIYVNTVSTRKALSSILKGIFDNKLKKEL